MVRPDGSDSLEAISGNAFAIVTSVTFKLAAGRHITVIGEV